jgi:uncharacterized protein YndB with AHSA1/START domain
MAKSTYVYVTYIRTTQQKLWSALTEPEFMKQYWFGVHAQCDWQAGAPWKLVNTAGQVMDTGEIVEIDPPRRMVIRWQNQFRPELKAEGASLCTMELEPYNGAIKLSITHSIDCDPSKLIEAVSGGWPRVLSNLKSLLETGSVALMDQKPANAKVG